MYVYKILPYIYQEIFAVQKFRGLAHFKGTEIFEDKNIRGLYVLGAIAQDEEMVALDIQCCFSVSYRSFGRRLGVFSVALLGILVK